MKLHVFNPEHEICLALDKERFTPSHNVVKMRKELSFIPALWAEDGDFVLVDDVDYAYKASDYLSPYINRRVRFVAPNRLRSMILEKKRSRTFDLELAPWGWDKALVFQMKGLGWPLDHLPSDQFLEDVRAISHRKTSKAFLEHIKSSFVSFEVTTINELLGYIEKYDNVVLKSPWSCSGRGIRFVNKENCTPSLMRWVDNIIGVQGCVMLEPHWDKLRDFAMEFEVKDGVVRYCGLSLFDTCYTAYSSSLVTTEENKREILEKYLFPSELDEVMSCCQDYLSSIIPQGYEGGIGVDMMIVKNTDGFKIHPCVEINFRRTMGHVALSFPTSDAIPDKSMVIEFARNFQLKLK